jgi:hypothetical protein
MNKSIRPMNSHVLDSPEMQIVSAMIEDLPWNHPDGERQFIFKKTRKHPGIDRLLLIYHPKTGKTVKAGYRIFDIDGFCFIQMDGSVFEILSISKENGGEISLREGNGKLLKLMGDI